MSEMLGNYFFLNQNYQSACSELENALKDDPSNNAIQRKLILCYIKLGYFVDGYSLFYKLINSDIDSIVHCYFRENPCPCLEIIKEFNDLHFDFVSEKYYFISLGILWLYCDIDRSIFFFNKAKYDTETDNKLEHVINIISNYAESLLIKSKQ